MSFGKSNYEGGKGFKKKNHFDMSGGSLVARIFPPFGTLADKGVWHVYHSVHWGYKNLAGGYRPFESPLVEKYDKETKTRTVEVADPALDRLNSLKEGLERAKAEGNDKMTKGLNDLVGMRGIYNIDRNHHLNVMLLDGTLGELKIRHKHFLVLKAEIDKLRAEGVDPLDLQDGRFFVFQKVGTGNETSFKADVYKEKIDVPGVGRVERDVVSTIGKEVLARVDSELFDLDGIFTKLTTAEVGKIVETSELKTGKSPACDEFFDARWKAQNAATKAAQSPASATTAPAATQAAPATAAATTTAPASPAATTANQNSPATAATQAAPAPTPATPPAASSQERAIEDMGDEEFLAWANNGGTSQAS